MSREESRSGRPGLCSPGQGHQGRAAVPAPPSRVRRRAGLRSRPCGAGGAGRGRPPERLCKVSAEAWRQGTLLWAGSPRPSSAWLPSPNAAGVKRSLCRRRLHTGRPPPPPQRWGRNRTRAAVRGARTPVARAPPGQGRHAAALSGALRHGAPSPLPTAGNGGRRGASQGGGSEADALAPASQTVALRGEGLQRGHQGHLRPVGVPDPGGLASLWERLVTGAFLRGRCPRTARRHQGRGDGLAQTLAAGGATRPPATGSGPPPGSAGPGETSVAGAAPGS